MATKLLIALIMICLVYAHRAVMKHEHRHRFIPVSIKMNLQLPTHYN